MSEQFVSRSSAVRRRGTPSRLRNRPAASSRSRRPGARREALTRPVGGRRSVGSQVESRHPRKLAQVRRDDAAPGSGSGGHRRPRRRLRDAGQRLRRLLGQRSCDPFADAVSDEQQAGADPHLDDVHDRGHPGRRLDQPVHRCHRRGVRDLPARLRLLDRLLPDRLLGRAAPGRVVDPLGRRQDLDLSPASRREVVRRRAVHVGRRGLHAQPDHQRNLRADQLRQLRREHRLGRVRPTPTRSSSRPRRPRR